jgi:hypothetical protein
MTDPNKDHLGRRTKGGEGVTERPAAPTPTKPHTVAALPAVQPVVTVKPLVWGGFFSGSYFIKVEEGGIANLWYYSADMVAAEEPELIKGGYLTLVSIDDLKAAANTHNRARILSAMNVQPAPDAARAGADAKPALRLSIERKMGMGGAAFDTPTDARAYTYVYQPSNQSAWKIGRASLKAKRDLAGDYIDAGLSLLRHLQSEGFGVFTMNENDALIDVQPSPDAAKVAGETLTLAEIFEAKAAALDPSGFDHAFHMNVANALRDLAAWEGRE